MWWVINVACVCGLLGVWCRHLYKRRQWLKRQQQPTGGATCKEVLEECYAAGGYAWDKIDDPIAYLREIE